MSKHHLDREIDELKKDLLTLSSMVEQNLSRSISALESRDKELALEVKEKDREIDAKEIEVEEECLKLLALHQPVANDLRFVVSTLKINNDLERIGDLTVNIGNRARYICEKDPIEIDFSFDEITEKTLLMVSHSLDCLIREDAKLAYKVCEDDDEVDALNKEIYYKVFDGIKKNPENVELFIHYMNISKHLERIADYATNIAEDVIYMIEGKIIRHGTDSIA